MNGKQNRNDASKEKKNEDKALQTGEKGYRLIKKRRKVTVMPDTNIDGAFDKENPYYIKIANKYRLLKYITSLLAIVFALSMLTVFSSDITAENFQYLIKDLDITGITSSGTFETVIYSGGSTSSFGIYRGELAVINAGSTMLYKPSGALSFNKTNNFYNPRLLVSSKYFLVYDRGETSFSYSIFNSFAELKSEKFEYPITLAELSDNGAYAVVTRDDSYRSIVRIYNSNFKLVNEVKKDKYITALALSDDGNRIGIVSAYDANGYFASELIVLGVDESKPHFTHVLDGKLPLKAHWLSNGDLCVVFSDGVQLYGESGELKAELSFDSMTSLNVAVGDDLILAVHNTTVLGYDKTVNVYDSNAELIYTASLEGELIKAVSYGKKVCLLFENRLVMIDIAENKMYEATVEPNAKDIVFYGNTVIVCYSGGASPLDLKEINTD